MNNAESPSPSHFTHRQILVIMSALMLGMLLAALDQTVVSTALPTIVGDLGGLNHLSWVVTSYLLASTISVPLYGKLGDQYGRKPFFVFAICIFLVGSMLSGLSQNMGELIGFRALQGMGAGGLMVGAQAIIGDVVSPRERGRYQGFMGGMFAISSVAGPLLGGFLTQSVSWRWIFYINVPIGAVALIVATTVLRLPRGHIQHRIDWVGAALLAISASTLILLTTWAGTQYAWLSTPIISLAIVCAVSLCAFFFVERRVPEPIIPPRLFHFATFRIASAVGFVIGLAMFGAIVFLPLFLQLVNGATPTTSGLNMLPLMVGLLGASIISGQVISRVGPLQNVSGHGHGARNHRVVPALDDERINADCPDVAVYGHPRGRSRARHAGAGARRPKRCGAQRLGSRHKLRHVSPLDWSFTWRCHLRCCL